MSQALTKLQARCIYTLTNSRFEAFDTLLDMIVVNYYLLAALFYLSTHLCHAALNGTLNRRNYFYVGEKFSTQGNSSIASGQIYVEQLTPQDVTQPFPVLVIHGHGQGHSIHVVIL